MSEAYGPTWSQRFAEAVDSARQLGGRAWMALLGIAVGCAALVALLNIGHSAAQHARQVFQRLGTGLMVINLDVKGEPAAAVKIPLTDLPQVICAVAPLAVTTATVRLGDLSEEVLIVGSTASLTQVLDLRVYLGRPLSRFDDFALNVVLGASLADRLQVQAGDSLHIGFYFFEVIGVLETQGYNPLLPVNFDEALLMPLAGMRRLNVANEISALVAASDDSGNPSGAAAQLVEHLRLHLAGYEITVQLPSHLLDSMASQSQLLRWMLAGTTSIAWLLGGVGVMNVMVLNVAQRRREIGVRLALGARSRDIAWLFVMEALILSATGALIGVFLGLAIAWLFAFLSGWRFVLAAGSLPAGMTSSLALGLFFSLHPALAATRLQPMQALRDD